VQAYDSGAQTDIFEPEATQHSERTPADLEVAAKVGAYRRRSIDLSIYKFLCTSSPALIPQVLGLRSSSIAGKS
jgi:hypothetical protein